MDPLQHAVDAMRSNPKVEQISLNIPELLHFLADRANRFTSFRHPLGFIHAELTGLASDIPEGMHVRVHLWTDATSGNDELGLVHDHMWQLTSMVLIGQLADVSIKAFSDPQGTHDAIRVKYGNENKFTHEGRVKLYKTDRRFVTPGKIYRIPSRSIHETQIIRAPAATLLVTQDDPPGSLGPIIFAPHPAAPMGTAVRETVPSEEVSALFRAAAAVGIT